MPFSQSRCETIGLSSPHTSPGFGAGPTSPHLEDQPFYQCPMPSLAQEALSANQPDGHDTEVPLRATRATGYFLPNEARSAARFAQVVHRGNSNVGAHRVRLFGFALYFGAVSWFVTRPAISKESKPVIHKTPQTPFEQFGPLRHGREQQWGLCGKSKIPSRLVIREGSFQQILQDFPTPRRAAYFSAKSIKTERQHHRDDLDSFISEQHKQDAARAFRVKRKSKDANRKSKEAQSERGGSSSSFRHEDQDTAGATSNRKKSKNADKKSVADSEDEISTIPANLSDSASTFEQQHSSSSVARTQLGSIRSIASSGRNHLSLARVGGLLMKFKLVFGFSQCVAFIPITFSLIPWPEVLVNLSHILYMISADVLSMFGNVCKLHTGFYPRFVFQMFLLTTIYLVTNLAYKISP